MALSLDKFRDVDLVIDKANDNFIQRQFVSQADYKGRTLTVQVTNNGEVGEIPGLFLNLRWQNQVSGLTDLTAFNLIDKENSVFRIEYPEHMMTPGKVVASIQLIHDGKTLHMKQFELTVQKLAGEAVGIVEKAEYSALVAVLSDANKFRTDIATLDVVKVNKDSLDTIVNALNTKINNIPKGSPSGTYGTVAALKAAYPNGDSNIYIVTADGNWYYWNGIEWTAGGQYQTTGIADGGVDVDQIFDEAVMPPKTSFLTMGKNLAISGGEPAFFYSNKTTTYEPATQGQNYGIVRVPVVPGKTYTCMRSSYNNDRFRIAVSKTYPRYGTQMLLIKGDSDPVHGVWSKDSKMEYYTFEVPQNYRYLVFYYSYPDVKGIPIVFEGTISDYEGFEPYKVIAKQEIELVDDEEQPLIKKGKNLWDGTYHFGNTIVGVEGTNGSFGTNEKGVIYVCQVTPGKTYTVSKSGSDRFRIGLKKSDPDFNGNVFILMGEESESINPKTFTIPDGYNYLYVYVSISGEQPFLQIEEGENQTEWETGGYQFARPVKKIGVESGLLTPEDFGAMGNANFIDGEGNVWTSSAKTERATDDSQAIQDFINQGGNVIFPGKRKYYIAKTIDINVQTVKSLDGGGSVLIVDSDISALKAIGTLEGSANPDSSGEKIFNEFSCRVSNLSVYGAKKDLGVGITIEKCFGLILDKCAFTYLDRGIVITGQNRNLIISNCHSYAMTSYGLHFARTCDLHQCNIIGCHISYCHKNVFAEECDLYNIQFGTCDIETSSYPDNAFCDFHFLAMERGAYEDIEIVGCTIEDHWNTDNMIIFETRYAAAASAITIVGNTIGNSNRVGIILNGCRGVAITGNSFKNSGGYDIEIKDRTDTLTITGNSAFSSKRDNGGFLKASGAFNLEYLTVIGNTLRNDGSSKVDLDVDNLRYSVIDNNTLIDINAGKNMTNCKIQDSL